MLFLKNKNCRFTTYGNKLKWIKRKEILNMLYKSKSFTHIVGLLLTPIFHVQSSL